MELKNIPVNELTVRIHHLWAKQWLVLTAGDFGAGRFNAMTVAWGGMGCMWNKPFVQVVVRPTRYTYEFIEQYESFTLCAFPDAHRSRVLILGTQSGRDTDKIAAAGLTPVAAATVAAPGFAEAELVVECRRMYWQDMNPGNFLDPVIEKNYPQKDYHRIYFGEVLAVRGTNP